MLEEWWSGKSEPAPRLAAVRTSDWDSADEAMKVRFQADVDELCRFVSDHAFDHVGVFTYSHEEGTSAYGLRDNVPAIFSAPVAFVTSTLPVADAVTMTSCLCTAASAALSSVITWFVPVQNSSASDAPTE